MRAKAHTCNCSIDYFGRRNRTSDRPDRWSWNQSLSGFVSDLTFYFLAFLSLFSSALSQPVAQLFQPSQTLPVSSFSLLVPF